MEIEGGEGMGRDERRRTRRYRCSGRVEIPLGYSRVPLHGMVLDMSPAGCGICVPAGTDFVEGEEECTVEVRFRTSYFSFRAVGVVRSQYRHAAYGGAMLGVEFVGLNARARADIAEFVRDQQDMRRAA